MGSKKKQAFFREQIPELVKMLIELHFFCDVTEAENTFVVHNNGVTLELTIIAKEIPEHDYDKVVEMYKQKAQIQKLVNPEHDISMILKNPPKGSKYDE